MAYMFAACDLIETIYVGDGWEIENVQDGSRMFLSCQKLVGSQGTCFDVDNDGLTYARIDGGPSYPGYFTYKKPTGIQGIKSENRISSVIYNLSGKKLAAPQKGINIINGKKFIIK